MDKSEREALATRIAWLRHWGDQARRITDSRQATIEQSGAARDFLRGRMIACVVEGQQCHLVPLNEPVDRSLMNQMVASRTLRYLTAADRDALSVGSDGVRATLERAEELIKVRRLFMGAKRRAEREADVQTVLNMYDRAIAEALGDHLDALVPAGPEDQGPAIDAAARELVGPDAAVVSGECVRSASAGREAMQGVRQVKDRAEGQIRQLGARIRTQGVDKALEEMPVQALKESTSGRLRLSAVEEAGLRTVKDVLEFGPRLHVIDGVGEQTARQTWAAAETMRSMLHRETPVRIDVKRREYDTERLLTNLWLWGRANRSLARMDDQSDLLAGLDALLTSAVMNLGAVPTHVVTTSDSSARQVRDSLMAIGRWQAELQPLSAPPRDPWKDFLANPADYLGWLNLLGFVTEDEGAAEGLLSADIIERVRAQDLDTRLLRDVSLRGYQDFGARFALAQRKVVIGDEMGLGKTIEALAVLAHVHAKGGTHSIVISPAAVVSNWSREIRSRSELDVHVLHGNERWTRLERWVRRGGVAVTTFETLKSVLDRVIQQDEIYAVVVDEAHYIKNPAAKRTVNTRVIVDNARHAVFLTGTPIENRVQEFSNLISYLQPELLSRLEEVSPNAFQRNVAPAYLRRNQEDVLAELPERIEVEEWIPMSYEDEGRYAAAVAEGNFMAMRRAALVGGARSAKVERLVELVDEARANHRKVIVFSYFRDVLDRVTEVLSGDVYGPLTGSVSADQRQRTVDDYTAAPMGAVLVSQITAGGVGLNIQAGSVVVICEPQVKPSMESQAIARAHRMGQTETVQVHRLLSDEGVDRRMVEILSEKQDLFDEFARVSHMANSAPEAVDITEAELAREVISAERERLARLSQAAVGSPTRSESRA